MPDGDGAGTPWWSLRRIRRVSVSLAVLAGLVALSWMPTGYFAVRPGPVRSLKGVVVIAGLPEPGTSLRMVAVVAEEANLYALLKAAVDPRESIWTKRDVYGDRTPGEYAEDSRALMERSQKTAIYLAFKESGFILDPEDPAPSRVSVKSCEVLGSSAGLAFALEMACTLQGVDLAAGRRVAATGTLDAGGRVTAVGGIAQKTIACRENGIELFLVPAADVMEAARNAGSMKVVGVRTLAEALAYLRGHDIP